jgi:HPt (histidine-containing phosphotransfer) domain-containing protein
MANKATTGPSPSGMFDIRQPNQANDPASLLSATRLAELRRHIGPDVLRGLVQDCLGELLDRLDRLERSLGRAEMPEVAAQAHAMTGIAAGYAMATLAAALRALLDAGRSGDVVAARKAAADLPGLLTRSHAALTAAISAP